jgi:integrating conjugative element relaxase (TIGR03760 family)
MFERRVTHDDVSKNKPIGHLNAVLSAQQLLQQDRRKHLLHEIQQRLYFNQTKFDALCLPLLETVALYCQQLPDSTCYYYANRGGLLNYVLNRTNAALELLQSCLLLNDTSTCTEEQLMWIYALFSAGLLQGLGKLYSDYKIEVFDSKGKYLETWNPFVGKALQTDTYYSEQFVHDHDVDFRRKLNLFLAKQLMPEIGLTWLASNAEIFAIWLSLLNEEDDATKMLNAILSRATIIAQQNYLHEFLDQKTDATQLIGKKFVEGAEYKPVSEPDFILGAHFLNWLNIALANGNLQLNKMPGLMLMRDGLFVHIEIFKQFLREHPQYKNWRNVQRAVAAWNLHASNKDFLQQKSSKEEGLMLDLSVISDTLHVYNAETKNVEIRSGLKINSLLNHPELPVMQQLSANGKWMDTVIPRLFMQPLGPKRGV